MLYTPQMGCESSYSSFEAGKIVCMWNTLYLDGLPTRHKLHFSSIRFYLTALFVMILLTSFGMTVPAQAASKKPVILNFPLSIRPGDIVGLQGENFGDDPTVMLTVTDSNASVISTTTLPLFNKFGNNWVSARVPESVSGGLSLTINNGFANSSPIKLNAARAYHLDTMQLVPGGAFRIFGRNLLLPGFSPTVSVDGLPAKIDLTTSDEDMLQAYAPMGLKSTVNVVIKVDNGNGTGTSQLDRKIEVVNGLSGDPFSLGVGWAAGFSKLAGNTIDLSKISVLAKKALCDGLTDDTAAIRSAIDLAARSGGGVVQLPEGNCRLVGSVKLNSRVVIQGRGKDKTLLRFDSDYALLGKGVDLAGLRNLALLGTGSAREGPLITNSTRVFIQNVRFELGGTLHMFLSGNTNFVVTGSDFIQLKNPAQHGVYTLNTNGGLVFSGNTTVFAHGSCSFIGVHDSYIANNHFSRDATNNQDTSDVIHTLVLDFAHRVAVIGNIFDVIGGPITNKKRNDGETILTEGGGPNRTESLGSVTGSTELTLEDSKNIIKLPAHVSGAIPENFGVAIVGGRGAGQTRRVIGYSGGVMTVDRVWDVIPDATSRYATAVWGLEKSLIKNNVLNQNPTGILFYRAAVREVDIVGNNINEGGGIDIRSFQNIKDRWFSPIYGIRVADNRIVNTSGNWGSYINVLFDERDPPDFGYGTIGIEVRNNVLIANSENVDNPGGDKEGFFNLMHFEDVPTISPVNQVRLLGTLLQGNTCIKCYPGFKVRVGAKGTVLEGNVLQ